MRDLVFSLGIVALSGLGSAQAAVDEPASALEAACISDRWSEEAANAKLETCRQLIDGLDAGHPLRVKALDALATLQLMAYDWEGALLSVDEALRIDPTAIDVRLHRIELLAGSPRAAEKWVDVDYLRTQHPDDVRTWRELGQYLLTFGSHADALEAFNKGLALDPADTRLWWGRSRTHRSLGRPAEAIADLEQVITINPVDRRAYIERAELEVAAGDPERAISDIEKVRSFGPSVGDDTSLIMAQAQMMKGEFEAAVVSLDAALASWPTQGNEALQRAALALRLAAFERLRDAERADAALTDYLKVVDPHKLLRLQVYLRNMGWKDVAITGTLDRPTRAALAACVLHRVCGGSLSRAI